MELSLSNQQRAIADRQLRKILSIGLCCSALVHTVAFATVNYLAQTDRDNLEITAIERVELDPEPKPTPVATPKPVPTPKLVKVTKSVPQPVKIVQPKPIATPSTPPVVKITKSAVAVKPIASPLPDLAKPSAKKSIAPKPAPIVPKVAAPVPFPDGLFEQPTPKPQPLATKSSVKQPPKVARKSESTDSNQTALATRSRRSEVLPQPDPNSQPDPINDDLAPVLPGNTTKLAKSIDDRSPTTTNQTNLATGNKSPQTFGNYDPAASTPTTEEDFGSGSPGNSKRIANNNPAPASSNNQTGLVGSRNQSKRSVSFDAAGGDTANPTDDIGGGAPGNNKRIASSTSGTSGSPGSNANSTGLGGNNRGNGSIAKTFGSDTGNGIGTGGDDIGGGTPGNLATGSSRQLSIQCLRNCEIQYPETLQDSETGKEKILVRVSINANGGVTNAEIARSSGNQNLDRAAVEGIKQMQLTPMGKPLTFKVKVSTLTNG
jgi:TonB family protein